MIEARPRLIRTSAKHFLIKRASKKDPLIVILSAAKNPAKHPRRSNWMTQACRFAR